MLSKKLVGAIVTSIRLSVAFGIAPFAWNANQFVLRSNAELKYRVLPTLSLSFVVFHFFYILFRSLYAYFVYSTSVSTLVLQLTLLAQSFMSIACHLNTYLRPEGVAELISKLLAVDRQLTSKNI